MDATNVDKQRRKREDSSSGQDLELQQRLLNVFKNAFSGRFGPGLQPVLQAVKSHLYNHEFSAAFGNDEYLGAYVARWSPSRALGYLQIFNDCLQEHLTRGRADTSSRKIVCLGGGAGAEMVACAGFLKMQREKVAFPRSHADKPIPAAAELQLDIIMIDVADWTSVVASLHTAITDAPPLSKHTSRAPRKSNTGLLCPDTFRTTFVQQDVLAMSAEECSVHLHDADLVTIMFTLNELCRTSLARTQAFLMELAGALRQGSLLLVVDGAGSYSTVRLRGTEKRYPMYWLLDHTLLSGSTHARCVREGPAWEKIVSVESDWFRLPVGLRYPIALENMRFQLHLYRRLP